MRKYGLPFLPLIIGLAVAVLWQARLGTHPIFYMRVDVGTLSLLLGLVGSVAWGMGLVLWAVAHRSNGLTLERFRQEQAEAHHRFIRRLDHELKNPLTAIHAGLVNLVERGDDSALTSVQTQVDRLARLTADLRKLADLETRPIEQEPVDLGQLLDEVLELARERRQSAASPISLNLPRVPWPLSPVDGDRDLLFLALHNLVDNACKFCGSDDMIEIRAFEDGPSVVVAVADNGPGVQEDELPHLGEELYRGSAARSVEGSGLGLALVQAIVKRHGGTMTIRSRLGQGTLVALRFPAMRSGKMRVEPK
jgi:two-component system OmpR family sensor kinase